ncbi:hypothetical protein K0504_13660 [Neiella marina]|uniref:Sel1 repeat family protein n=1 Tax=Neiella holothuriorum TaxID=2870530 RepID=A0ABS7EIA0_9GAMM|nr:hypothetical protein [Neiella holothuriorum]MBW8192084.1 hypothetical protein [Neiella holothuriorum]
MMKPWLLLPLVAPLLLTGCGSDLLVLQRLQALKPSAEQPANNLTELDLPGESDWVAQFDFAESLLDKSQPLQALEWYSKCANGGYLPCVRQLGYAYLQGGAAGHDPYLGIELLTQSLDQTDPTMLNDMAWFLSTSKLQSLRDPQQAKQYMEKRQQLGPLDAMTMDTLAAVTAALGEFDGAAKVQQKAITMLLKEGGLGEDVLSDYRSRLQLYRNQKAYTE